MSPAATSPDNVDITQELKAHLRRLRPSFPEPMDLAEFRRRVMGTMAKAKAHPQSATPELVRTWESEGVSGAEVRWSTGWGCPTAAYVLRPAGQDGLLPGILALNSHDGSMYFGKEKIADGPDGVEPRLAGMRQQMYGGRAYANELARRGYVVLVHDAFPWGSRNVPLESMLGALRDSVPQGDLDYFDYYDRVARDHEHLLEKYCRVLGSSFAELVLSEDLVALQVLKELAGVDATRLATIGLSGGGCRAALLHAYSDDVAASVVSGMMSTHEHLLEHVPIHTWMFFPPGLAEIGDWPDLVASRAPVPLLVQYNEEDEFFPLDGMKAADARISRHYVRAGQPEAYQGVFYPGQHKFDLPMQEAAFSWLGEKLGA